MARIKSPLAEGENQFKTGIRDLPRQNYGRLVAGLKRAGRKIAASNGRRSPLKRYSKGLRAEHAKYNASAPEFFRDNPDCLICIRLREDGENIVLRKARERHHIRGRIGRLLNWRPGWKASCHFHRSWPHDNPARARRLGLLAASKDWNVFPENG